MVAWLIAEVRPRAEAIALLVLIAIPGRSAAQLPSKAVACATATACVAQARDALSGGGPRRHEAIRGLLARVARPCFSSSTDALVEQTCEAALPRIRTAQALLEQACELGAHQACEDAASAALMPWPESATCGQAEVCFRLGLMSCPPPCRGGIDGTEVNEAMAVSAYEHGCRLGNAQSCHSLLEFMARGFGRTVAHLGGDPGTLACGRASQTGGVRAPRNRLNLAELCRRGVEYCGEEGFFLPCEGLAHQRALGRVSDAEWSAVRGALEETCSSAGDGGSDARGGSFACEATRRLALPAAVERGSTRSEPLHDPLPR